MGHGKTGGHIGGGGQITGGGQGIRAGAHCGTEAPQSQPQGFASEIPE